MIGKGNNASGFGTSPPPEDSLLIERLNLDNETYTLLKRAHINTVWDITETERGKGLLRIRNIGRKHYQSIQNALLEIGLLPDGSAPETDLQPDVHEMVEANENPAPVSWAETENARLKTVAFIDYEHWFIGLKDHHQRKPNIQAWFDDAKKRGNLIEVTFFGDFSDIGGMRDEINNIRLFTNRIIETKNTSIHSKKDFTDFIILDNIYQKVIASPEIEQIILFTGDGHFSGVASYLRNFCSKVVGVYGVDDAISSQLEATADWCVRLPFESERYMECRDAILKNLKYAEDHTKSPMFRHTVRIVSEDYNFDADIVETELRRMIEEGVVYSVPTRSRRDYKIILNILKVNWALADREQKKIPAEMK